MILTLDQIQVREEYPICGQSQNTTKHKNKFITTLQHVSAYIIGHLQVVYETYILITIVCMP